MLGATGDSSARCADRQARLRSIRSCEVSWPAFRAAGTGVDRKERVVYSHAPVSDERKSGAEKIVPIVLAAGPSRHLPLPKALARFGRKTALALAVENCSGFERPIVVLGCDAARIRRAVPPGVRVVVNRRWKTGQLGSLLVALRHVPRGAAFLVYPVDHPLLTRAILRRLSRAFARRSRSQAIILPIYRGRVGHPAIFAAEVRREFRRAQTAREVVYGDLGRVKFVSVNSTAIWLDFDTTASYRRCLRKFKKQAEQRSGQPRKKAVAK